MSKRILICAQFILIFLQHESIAQQNVRGLLFENDKYNALPISLEYGKFEKLPPRFSNTFYPKVVNQAFENNGVAWSLTWYGLAALGQRDNHFVALSPSFTYKMSNPKSKNCGDPISIIAALNSLVEFGAPSAKMLGFFCADSLTQEIFDSAAVNKLSGYARLFNAYDSKDVKVQSIKRAVADRNPVVIGLICPPSFQFAKDFWQPREQALEEYGGNTVTVVGFDESKFGGAFEVVNSWGKKWGKNGYSWLRYDDVADFVLYGFELFKNNSLKEASIDFETSAKERMKLQWVNNGLYRFQNKFLTGTEFKISVKPLSPLFMLLVGTDPEGNTGIIFPSSDIVVPLAKAQLTIPNDGTQIKLVGSTGKNLLSFVFASNQDDLAKIKKAIESQGINAIAKYSHDGIWDKSKLEFKSNDEIVVVQVELEQN
jgi:hypothetical protein